MGYNTDFDGSFKFSRELTVSEYRELESFSRDRHDDITYPSCYCQWETDGISLYWDGQEKFYGYEQWLKLLINKFFIPWGITLNGKVRWRGEAFDDIGTITVLNNVVMSQKLKFEL